MKETENNPEFVEVTPEVDDQAESAPEVIIEEMKETADEIVERVKELVEEGNVSFIRIRKGDLLILNLPITAGVVGTIIGIAAAPWAVIFATLATVGLGCTVEVEDKDGVITVIHAGSE